MTKATFWHVGASGAQGRSSKRAAPTHPASRSTSIPAPSRSWPSDDAWGIALVDPVAVAHAGCVIVFARQSATATDRIYYNIRRDDVATEDEALNWSGWYELNLAEQVGATLPAGATTPGIAALLRVGGATLVTVPPIVTTTAAADAPFRAVSDGPHICVFRQSSEGTLYLNRFLLLEESPPSDGRDAESSDGPPPLVLQPLWETRYQRSGVKDAPAGPKDTLGSRGATGDPFIEPTLELAAFDGITQGRFAVVAAPTATAGAYRWYVVSVDSAGRVQVRSVARASDGLFDLDPARMTSFTITPTLRTPTGLAPMACTGGAGAGIFARQEPVGDGTGDVTAIRRSAHLMLCVPVSATAPGLPAATAIYDFALGADGNIGAFDGSAGSVLIDGTLSNGAFVPTTGVESYPVPASAVHTVGALAVTAVVLGQVAPGTSAPLVTEGADGLVHCYYQGPPSATPANAFMVAQFSPLCTRDVLVQQWQAGAHTGAVQFVAAATGSTFDGMTMTVSDPAGGAPDLCDIAISYGASSAIPSEQWSGVPRRLQALMSTLTGEASNDVQDPRVQSGAVPFYDYEGARAIARLPVTGASGAPPSSMLIVSRRADLPLTSAAVAAPSGTTTTLSLTFTAGSGSGATAISQSWTALPTTTGAAAMILRGSASASTYGYVPGPGDTKVYGLSTSAGLILLSASAATQAATVKITVAAPTNGDSAYCNVVLTIGSSTPTTLENVRRAQADLVAALRASAAFTAAFAYVSPDPLGGSVGDQVVTQPLSLRELSTLFGVFSPDSSTSLQAASVSGAMLQGHTQSPAPTTGSTPPHLLALSVSALGLPATGADAIAVNGTASVTQPAGNGAWVVAPALESVVFGGQNAMTVPVSTSASAALSPALGWTVEAWIKPTSGAAGNVVSYYGGAAPTPGGVAQTYLLGTLGQTSLSYASFTPSGPYAGSNVLVQADPNFEISGGITWEAWIKPASSAGPAGALGCVMQAQDDQPDPALYQIGLDGSLRIVFAYRDVDGNAQSVSTSASVPSAAWTHVAVTLTPHGVGVYAAQLYLDAVAQLATPTDIRPWGPDDAPKVYVGASDLQNVSMFGSMAELRYWRTARTAAELRRTMYTGLTGAEPGLYGYWTLTEAVASGTMTNSAASTGKGLDGTCQPSPDQPMSSASDGTFVGVVGGVGGLPAMRANAFLLTDRWHHVALTFAAGTAVNLNPSGAPRVQFGACRPSGAFDLSVGATLEAWIVVPSPGGAAPRFQTILGKWGPRPGDQSYQLSVSPSGTLTAQVALDVTGASGPDTLVVTSSAMVADGTAHHVAATLATATSVDPSGQTATATCTLSLYVDGQPSNVAVKKYAWPTTSGLPEVMIQRSASVLCVGAACPATVGGQVVAIETQAPFIGALTGVRLWAEALDAQGVLAAFDQRRAYDSQGAIAAWWFGEQTGAVAYDSVGDDHLVLNGTDYWVGCAALSTVAYYADGRQLLSLVPALASSTVGYGVAPEQFTAGASQTASGLTLGFQGEIDELRLWKTTRTRQELDDHRFGALRGDERDLAAYWRMNGSLVDATGGGNDGAFQGSPAPTYAVSGAPVANEGPWVRNVYGGVATSFQEPVQGTPAVVEYGDMQRAADGTLQAVMKRGYYFVNESLALMPGFKVGELDLVHLGQVQSDPMLIGFIEGAPPVPSENLSRPFYISPIAYTGYHGASSIALNEARASTITFNTVRTEGSAIDAAFGGGFYGVVEKNAQVAPVGVAVKVTKGDWRLGPKVKIATTDLTTDGTALSSGWTDSISDTMALRGDFEPPAATPSGYLNPRIGRRFVPDNVGYALVESLTADLFGMRLRATGIVVGTTIVPDTSIPPDKNIITFRIDPRYVKNGTLDGKVGLVNDPHYPDADLSPGSYFKPTEAYVLKGRVERERADIETYFAQYKAKAESDGTTEMTEEAAEQFYDWANTTNRKSTVNSYVWTASGGLHREQEQVASQRTRSYQGSYKLVHQYGVLIDGKLAPAPGLGGFWSVDLLFGRQLEVTVAKSRLESEAFGLDALVAPDPVLQAWDPAMSGGQGGFTAEPCPGKVTGYRFMTFYLAPSHDNASAFAQVVDQDWLRNSSDPNAVALRSARIGQNAVWRVLHRVTFVSRVPPAADDNPDLTVSLEPPQPIIVRGNELLIRLVQQALGAGSPTPANLGAAVLAVLDPPADEHGTYPVSLLGAEVPWWETFLATTRGSAPDPAAQAALFQVTRDTLSYATTGYATAVLPLA